MALIFVVQYQCYFFWQLQQIVDRAHYQSETRLVPAESIKKEVFGNFDFKIPSAKGDLQIFPKQTIRILVITCALYR